jgi:hypothetical protein
MPAERAQSLGRNVNVCLGLYGIQDLHDAGMAECAQLAERIAGEGQSGLICGDVEGEYATLGAIFLAD